MRFLRSYPNYQPSGPLQINWSNPITRGMVALFPLGPEDLGTRNLVDGTPVTRTTSSSFFSVPAREGSLLQFDLTSSLDFTPPNGVTSTTPITFCWLQEPRNVSGDMSVIDWKAPGATFSFLIYQHASSSSYAFVAGRRSSGGGGTEQTTFSDSVGLATNFKHDVFVLTLENGMDSTTGVRLWRNGVEMPAGIAGGGNNFASSTAATAKIGNNSSNNIGFDGLLGNVGIFNRALSPAEAADLSRNIWQLYEPDRVSWIPTSEGGTVTVTSDKALSYSIRDLVTKDSTLSYFVREVVSKDASLSYSIRSEVISDKSLSYSIRSLVSSDRNVSYDIRGFVQKDISLSYPLRGIVQSDRSISYEILSAIVISSLSISYDIRTSATADKSLSYNIRTFVNSDLGLQYLVRLLVQKDVNLSYLIRLLTSKDLSLSHDIRGSVQKDRNVSYEIQGIVQVLKDLNIQYSILEDPASDAVVVTLGANPTITITIGANSAVIVTVE